MKNFSFIIALCLIVFRLNADPLGPSPAQNNLANKSTIITNDEKYLIQIDGKILKLFDHQKKSFLCEIAFPSIILNSISSSNSKFVAISFDKHVALVDLEKKATKKTWNEHSDMISELIISNTSQLLISSSYDNTAIVYDLNSMKVKYKLIGHTDNITSLNISHDDQFCSTSSIDHTTRIWNLKNGKNTQTLVHTSNVNQAIFKPNELQLFTLCNDDTVRAWDVRTGKIIHSIQFPLDDNDSVSLLKWSPTGKYLIALTGHLSPSLLIYDYDNKKIHATKSNFTEPIEDFGITDNEKNYYLHNNGKYILGEISSDKISHEGDNFKTCSKNYIYITSSNGILGKYSKKDLTYSNEGFYYVLLESRPRIFLISCAVDKYDPPLVGLHNCVNDAKKIINYFHKSKKVEKEIEHLKELISSKNSLEKKENINRFDSLQMLLSKEPIIFSYNLHDYALSRQSLIDVFNKVKREIRNDDALVFHFAGMGGKIKNSDTATLFFSKDTASFTPSDLFQLSEIINGKNQLFILDACQDDFVSQFKSELLYNKSNSQLINRNRVFLAIKNLAVDNYKQTGGGAITYAFINNNTPFNQIFSHDNRLKNEYDYKLYNGTKEISEDKSLNFEIFRESDYYDIKFKEKNGSRGGVAVSIEEEEEKVNSIGKGQTLSVVVGINAYLNLDSLTNPVLDAEKISSILETTYGHKVIFLKDVNYMSLADTLFSIKESYEFQEGSQFLFYFAGHGSFNKYDNSSCLLFKDSKLNPAGIFNNSMTAATLKGLIYQIKSTRTMVVIDACHSRKLTEECKEAECSIDLDQSNKFDNKVLDGILKSPGKVIFTSANVFQEASDGEKYNYSPFANAFMASLKDRTSRKILFDSKAVYKDMLKYQSDKTKNKYFQSDMKYCSYNDSYGEDDRFIFIPK